MKYDVPPEIVKAIAEKESSGWIHFNTMGKALYLTDKGIGIMQVTNHPKYDEDELKNNIVYNIIAGVEILDEMFERKDLPQINDMDRDVLEHWYFAIMAYNGTKPRNSPVERDSEERNVTAYQEEVYDIIDRKYRIKTVDLPFEKEDFQYETNSTKNIRFVTKDYHFQLPLTKTKDSFTAGQQVKTTSNVKLRERATTGSNAITVLSKGEVVTITGPAQYDENNFFVWYPVKRSNGVTGYVASNYVKHQFKDVPTVHYAQDEIDYLVDRGILKGVSTDEFGMGQSLKRWQAVLLLTRTKNISLENHPDPGFTDVPKSHPYYKQIAASVATGMFKGKSDTEFDPDGTLTRAEMAVLLPRLFDFPEAAAGHPFTDLTQDWYRSDVIKLYQAGITAGVTPTEFRPRDLVTREQFAAFLVRAMDESFRIK